VVAAPFYLDQETATGLAGTAVQGGIRRQLGEAQNGVIGGRVTSQ
jgi:hypothetical protein